MSAKNHISKREYKSLLISSFLTSIFAFVSLASVFIVNYNNFVIEKQMKLYSTANEFPTFEIYSFERSSFLPFFCFFSLFIFAAVIKTKNFATPFLLTAFSLFLFVYEFYQRRNFIFGEFSDISLFEKFASFGNIFDYITFVFVSILLFWQISILLRMLIKTSQKENVLP